MSEIHPPIHYSEYLKVDQITNLQNLKSSEYGATAHDEMLFIVIHQVYELWFKQILFEIDSIIQIFSHVKIDEREMLKVSSRLGRIIEIQDILVDQIKVLETMTPMDFLEFRDFLYPASGFQSVQFRLIENKLGLIDRITYNKIPYKDSLSPDHRSLAKLSEEDPSLFELLEKWLERTPFVQSSNFDFWKVYQHSVSRRLKDQITKVENSSIDKETQEKHLGNIEQMKLQFQSIFDESTYKEQREKGVWRLSHTALQAALFIHLYRDEPALQLPFQVITQLQTIDENFTQWRYRHAQLAHRMLGAKMGTGGSTGHKYLKAAGNKHKVYGDFVNLATFFIPKSDLPELPDFVQSQVDFNYSPDQ